METFPEEWVIGLGRHALPTLAHCPGKAHVGTEKGQAQQYLGIGLKVDLRHKRRSQGGGRISRKIQCHGTLGEL